MRIAICCSISAFREVEKIEKELSNMGHDVKIPLSIQRILNKELTFEEFNQELSDGEGHKRKIDDDIIKRYFYLIKESDVILVVNVEKDGKDNYIGGNTFLEMGFAHVLDKKIFLLNPVPDNSFKDEILAMQPEVIDGDLSRIK